MGLKNWPAWLKGGIIGAIISLLVSLSYFFLIQLGFGVPTFFLFELPIKVASFIFGWGQVLTGLRVYVSALIFSPIFYFIIGALIGLIISKIKSKK